MKGHPPWWAGDGVEGDDGCHLDVLLAELTWAIAHLHSCQGWSQARHGPFLKRSGKKKKPQSTRLEAAPCLTMRESEGRGTREDFSVVQSRTWLAGFGLGRAGVAAQSSGSS